MLFLFFLIQPLMYIWTVLIVMFRNVHSKKKKKKWRKKKSYVMLYKKQIGGLMICLWPGSLASDGESLFFKRDNRKHMFAMSSLTTDYPHLFPAPAHIIALWSLAESAGEASWRHTDVDRSLSSAVTTFITRQWQTRALRFWQARPLTLRLCHSQVATGDLFPLRDRLGPPGCLGMG